MTRPSDLFNNAWGLMARSRARLMVGHDNPDGDAVASVLAMAYLAQGLPGQNQIYLPSSPVEFNYLPGFNSITNIVPREFDCVVALDYGAWPRTGLNLDVPEKLIITLDHHLPNRQRGGLCIVRPEASSTCELIYEFATALNLPIDRQLAFLLLTGIMTDTGNLQYASTSSRTLEIVEKLILAGAPLPKVARRIDNQNPAVMLKGWAKLLHEVQVDEALGVVYVLLPLERQKSLGLLGEQYSGFASFLATIPGHRAAVLLREDGAGAIQGSLRSDGPQAFNVAKVAEALDGGGHARAAGFTFNGSLAGAWANLRLAFQEALGDTV